MLGSGKIGDRARDFQDAIVSARRKTELFHRVLQQIAERIVDGAMLADLRLVHACIGRGAGVGKAYPLPTACGLDAVADGVRGLAQFLGTKLRDRKRGRLDVDVDAIQQRAADPCAVALDLRRRAAALVLGVSEVAARAGVHRGNQHERAGQRHFAGAAGYRYLTVFKRQCTFST